MIQSVTRYLSPATLYPSPTTGHPSPANRHPLPATRYPSPVEKCCRYPNPKHVIQRALQLPSISHTCFFDTTNPPVRSFSCAYEVA